MENGKALGRRPFEMPALDLPLDLYPHPHLTSFGQWLPLP